MKKISVIVPCFNIENYVKDCIESIINQSYPNIEIVCIDDGSTDNTLMVLEKELKSHSNVVILSTENQGVTAARKYGVESSSGEYISFVDGDDQLPRNSLETLVGHIESEHVDMVVGSHEIVRGDVITNSIYQQGFLEPKKYSQEIVSMGIMGSLCMRLFKRALLTEDVFDVSREINFCEDQLMNFFISSKLDKIFVTSDIVYSYIKRDGSVTSNIITFDYAVLLSEAKETAFRKCGFIDSESKHILSLDKLKSLSWIGYNEFKSFSLTKSNLLYLGKYGETARLNGLTKEISFRSRLFICIVTFIYRIIK